MLEVSEQIYSFFQAQNAFVNQVQTRLYPVVAKEGVAFPFAVYTINEQQALTKDGGKFIITLSVYFTPDKFKACATFADVCKTLIETKYSWLGSEIGFVPEDQSITVNINFEINK